MVQPSRPTTGVTITPKEEIHAPSRDQHKTSSTGGVIRVRTMEDRWLVSILVCNRITKISSITTKV